MPVPSVYSFTQYLAAKKSVDDRALNRHVWQSLVRAIPDAVPENPLRVLEVGAGIGTMLERLLDWGLLTHAAYTAIDADSDSIDMAHNRLPSWAASNGFGVEEDQGRLYIQRGERSALLELEAVDLFDFVGRERGHRAWDLLIAHAFLDLMNIPIVLPSLFSLIRRGGLFYFTLVFDGDTIFQPELDPALDGQIETLYHQTMDQRVLDGNPSGDSRSGRHLFSHLRTDDVELLDVGSSDWVVFAGPEGYHADEAYFLHFIVHTVDTALKGHPDLDAARFADWIEQRHAQIERGVLVYIAHQLDFLGRVLAQPPSSFLPHKKRSPGQN
jgi:SAM-dependent methyltransferase